MWVVVKFSEDVSAVLFSWIRIDEQTGETMCFWPRKNAEKKRAKPNIPIDLSDGTFYPCRILMKGAKFDTLQEAIKMEIRGQTHSSVETNDESTNKTRKRTKKQVFTLAETTKSKRKITPKAVSSSDESSCESSDSSLSEPMQMSEYTFKKSKIIKMRDCFKSFDAVISKTAAQCMDPNNISVIDVVPVVSGSLSKIEHNSTNCDEHTNGSGDTHKAIVDAVIAKPSAQYMGPKSISIIDETVIPAVNSGSLSNMGDKTTNRDEGTEGYPCESGDITEYSFNLNDIGFQEYNSESIPKSAKVGDIIQVPYNNTDSENISQRAQDNEQPNIQELILKQFTQLNTKLDAFNTKLDLVTSTQEGIKTVLVDLTAKILRLEERMEMKNAPKLTLSQELSIPIACPDSFKLNEAALLAKKTTAENLVSYICSVNFQSELEMFIKQAFLTVFDMDFFYGKIIWSHETDRIYIKDKEVMQCIVRSVKGRFPALQMPASELDDKIYVAAKKLKDCHRKQKNKK